MHRTLAQQTGLACPPAKLHADKAYASRQNRDALLRRSITPRIARPGIDSSQLLGRFRWVVERTQASVVAFRKLAVRYDPARRLGPRFAAPRVPLICLRFLAHAEAAAH